MVRKLRQYLSDTLALSEEVQFLDWIVPTLTLILTVFFFYHGLTTNTGLLIFSFGLASAVFASLWWWERGLLRIGCRWRNYQAWTEANRRRYFGEWLAAVTAGERYHWLQNYLQNKSLTEWDFPAAMEFIPSDLIRKHFPDYEAFLLRSYLLWGQRPELDRSLNFADLEHHFPEIYARCSGFLEDPEIIQALLDFPYHYLVKYRKPYRGPI